LNKLPTRRHWIAALAAAGCCCAYALAVSAGPLAARLDGDYLRITAPHLDFLSGKPLERLKDGQSVAFIGQLTITSAPSSMVTEARSVARFALSYDIWEERFSVTKIGERPEARHSVSHLSVAQAENWCLDNLAIDRSQIPSEQPFYVQLDLRAEDPRDQLGIIGDPGINITRLIEIFGRPARGSQPRWSLSNGPYRLADLKKTEARSSRG
jgi:hypothetical protein